MFEKLQGKFIVFDGPDGSGKSTQRDLVAKRLTAEGLEVALCKDPGGTEIGNRIRHILLGYDLSEMDVRCETFLFMASRAQLLGEIAEPALKEGKVVLCDRFVSSTCAYQGAAGYDPHRVIEVAKYAIDDTWPDLTFVFDISPEDGFARTGRSASQVGKNRKKDVGQTMLFDSPQVDAMEARSIEFHRKVREGFLTLRDYYPRPVEIIDASRSPEEVHESVVETLLRVDF